MTEERNDLLGWEQVFDRPTVDELNRTLATFEKLDRPFLIRIAGRIPCRRRNPSSLQTPSGTAHGLTFVAMSGSILLTFPAEWPADPLLRVARLYTMGNATEEAISRVVRLFNEQLEDLPPLLAEARLRS